MIFDRWENGGALRGFRETINWITNETNPVEAEDVHSIDLWVHQGYNVGIFYWDQYSDEDKVEEAERKIYNATEGSKMRWKRQNFDGSVIYIQNPSHLCASDTLVTEYLSHFGNTNALVHVVGHSLGTQMVLELSRKLPDISIPHAYPTRITLLDPFFSKGKKSYSPFQGNTIPHRVAETLSLVTEGRPLVPIETYITSLCGSGVLGAYCPELKLKTVYHKVDMMQFPWHNVAHRHICAVHVYFCSMNLNHSSDTRNPKFFNPHVEDAELRKWMPRKATKSERRNRKNLPIEVIVDQPADSS